MWPIDKDAKTERLRLMSHFRLLESASASMSVTGVRTPFAVLYCPCKGI